MQYIGFCYVFVVVVKMEQPLGNNGVFEGEKLQYEENKQSEVLKAAKSLFSKRTRTLYHWMCPNASKHQLKMAIANSWETLSVEEKEFYISQVDKIKILYRHTHKI